jgi:hypothetical protein
MEAQLDEMRGSTALARGLNDGTVRSGAEIVRQFGRNLTPIMPWLVSEREMQAVDDAVSRVSRQADTVGDGRGTLMQKISQGVRLSPIPVARNRIHGLLARSWTAKILRIVGDSALLKSAVDNGWRLGLAMLSAGAAVPILDRFDLLRPGGLSKWSGVLIFVAGLAALITSMVGHAITTARSRSAGARVEVGEEDAAEAREEDASVLANIQTLSKQELAILYVALTVPQRRYEVDPGTIGDQLLKKNIFVAVGVVPRVAFVCEVHPAVLAERTRLLPALREAAESANEFPSVQQRASGWIVV